MIMKKSNRTLSINFLALSKINRNQDCESITAFALDQKIVLLAIRFGETSKLRPQLSKVFSNKCIQYYYWLKFRIQSIL